MNKFRNKTITQNLAEVVQEIYHYVCGCSTRNLSTNNDDYIVRRLGMDKTDHEIIMSLYWLLEDTELALIEFHSHQLQGPTRQMNNLGEKYLRLYGTLNAINLQMSALVELFEIFKLPGKKEIKAKSKSLQAIVLRHKIGAHSLDYMDASKVRNFRISRHSIDDNTLELIVLNKEGHERIHLIGALDEFQQFFHKELYNACASVIEKIIPDSATIKAEISRSMELINETIKGNIVMEAEGMKTVILTNESKGNNKLLPSE